MVVSKLAKTVIAVKEVNWPGAQFKTLFSMWHLQEWRLIQSWQKSIFSYALIDKIQVLVKFRDLEYYSKCVKFKDTLATFRHSFP